jgi:alkylation response protein AidB-like acyl-CoA dehydrogenase
MATRIWQVETALYRTVGCIDQGLLEAHDAASRLKAIEEYAIECALLKVMGSEGLDFVADEGVQIFGGNGYSQEYPVERYYRDARINRIFEGTNEINRLLVPNMLLRRATRGDLPLDSASQSARHLVLQAAREVRTLPATSPELLARLKQVPLALLGTAVERFGKEIGEQQELMARAADMMMCVFAADSASSRAAQASGPQRMAQDDMAAVVIHEAAAGIESLAMELATTLALDADTTKGLRALCAHEPVDVIATCRRIAERVLA